ncbi:hypothetical protein [Thermogymnomonas acidicola]|uniref:hypothetical protein n=1 Tax=Thermogymnomonas acidicola TaxID=399579 RepID=UPI001396CA99|nr:hypothetical protein [Thermogymnomonas acidicola]
MKIREVAEGGPTSPPPRTDVLSPLGGGEFIKLGLRAVYGDLEPSFYAEPIVRKPSVYNGMPFQVEVGMVYGGALNPHGTGAGGEVRQQGTAALPAGLVRHNAGRAVCGLEAIRPRAEERTGHPVRASNNPGPRVWYKAALLVGVEGSNSPPR